MQMNYLVLKYISFMGKRGRNEALAVPLGSIPYASE